MTVTKGTGEGVRVAIGKILGHILKKAYRRHRLSLFHIDRGGTFTDVWASLPGKPDVVLKLLSVDPANYADAPTEGESRPIILRILNKVI